MPSSYRQRIYQRTKQILWGPIEVIAAVLGILVIVSQPVMDYLLRLWGGLPWWVGVLLLGGLLLYALLRAGYELWKEAEQARLKAEQERDEQKLPDTFAEWLDKTPLAIVRNRTFRNDRIELDGNHYNRCVFDSCTFSFKGTKPFEVAETCQIRGDYNIDAPAPQAMAILRLLKSLDTLANTKYRDPIDGELVD